MIQPLALLRDLVGLYRLLAFHEPESQCRNNRNFDQARKRQLSSTRADLARSADRRSSVYDESSVRTVRDQLTFLDH